MNNAERIANLKPEQYQALFVVKKETFDRMLEILEGDYQKKHRQGGRPPKLSVLDKLIIMLEYYKEYRVMECIAFDYGVRKSTICDAIHWVEETLIKSGQFSLPSKRELWRNPELEAILLDATESEIERPKKKQRQYYSGKKKRHTMKTQIIADKKSLDIICVFCGSGKTHDFQLYKNSKTHMSGKIESLQDKGYQGLQKLHANSTIPVKASKNHPLTEEEKKLNREISKRRIYIEHINRYIKRFRILSYRYRNKRKRFGLRVSLICGIYNFQHAS